MFLAAPGLRLRVDADLAEGAPLYVLALEGLSIVAALYELSEHLAVTLQESFLDESEYAAEVSEVLSPMALTTRTFRPGAPWNSHATLRLHTETKVLAGNETSDVVKIDFTVHDLECSHESLYLMSPRDRVQLLKAYEEEKAIIRALDGFSGDSLSLRERMETHVKYGAILARAQLLQRTADRARMGLHGLYTRDPKVRERIDEILTWLMQMQVEEEISEESLVPSIDVTDPSRMH